MTTTMCNSGATVLKAGANAVELTDDQYTQLINQAESWINVNAKRNYTDDYAGLNADVAKLLEDACSSWSAIAAISYNMEDFTTRAEAQTMMDMNHDRTMEIIKLLRQDDYSTYVDRA